MDKHLRPYKCPVPACTVNNFATPGDLKRHEQEVHATPAYNCPITTCKRHRRGFSRKDNLVQHLKRTHNHDQDQDMENTTAFSPPAWSLGNDFAAEQSFSAGSADSLMSANVLISSVSSPSDKISLITKLSELEKEKEKAIAKFDGDIAALKRVLSFM